MRLIFQVPRKIGTIILFTCLIAYKSNAQIPAFPPNNVTSTMDWQQMLSQLNLTLPVLPLKKDDPNREANSISRQADGEGDYSTLIGGFQLTRSSWGLWTQYTGDPYTYGYTADSLQLGLKYTPINLLKAENGTPINDVYCWQNVRRPEIVDIAQTEIWGKIPDASILPAVTWNVVRTTGGTGAAAYFQYVITGTIDISRYPQVRNVPRISATMRIPQSATGPAPVIIAMSTGAVSATHYNAVYPKGWGVCSFNVGQLQPDNGAGLTSYLIGLVNQGNWRKPDDWGALVAWSWGASKLIDLFETYEFNGQLVVDAKRVGVTGHSRWGKAALVTMAYEPRIAIGFPSCSGALGVVQSQRHWGEELELVAGSGEYHWVAGNIMKYCGELNPGVYKPRKVENLKVDGQSLLALCAPRPVFLNGGKPGDSWQDPYGAFLSAQLASPAWELYGYKGVIMEDKDTINRDVPILDKNYITGKIGYRKHSVGGHADTQQDWAAFAEFAERYLNNKSPQVEAGQTFNIDQGMCNVIGTVSANDPDGHTIKNWQVVGEDCKTIFKIDPATGNIYIIDPSLLDVTKSSYKLMIAASDGNLTGEAKEVIIKIPAKFNICHNGKMINVSKNSVLAHINHGDCIGGCESATISGRAIPEGEVGVTNSIVVYPNPGQGVVNISLGQNSQHITTIRMYDLSGKLVKQISVNGKSNLSIATDKVLPGIYLLKMQGDKVITEKILIQ